MYPAKVVPQLNTNDGPWCGSDCWIASTRGMIAFASDGKVKIDAETARKRSGKWVGNPSARTIEKLGPGNFSDIVAVIKHPDTVAEFHAAGLHPPKVRSLGVVKIARVKRYLTLGYQAAIAIDYAVVNRVKPQISGDPAFNGFHSTRVYGAYDEHGKVRTSLGLPFFTDSLDPLADGRRRGIAKGPQRISGRFLAQECGSVRGVGKGNVLALVVKPADPIHKTPPTHDPEPTGPCSEQVAALTNQLVAANAELGRLQGQNEKQARALRAVQAALADVPAAMNVIAAIVNDPENTGGVES
jgi:hypothetical protein